MRVDPRALDPEPTRQPTWATVKSITLALGVSMVDLAKRVAKFER
jgi:hypothetical protein